jgi:hypothetical protein
MTTRNRKDRGVAIRAVNYRAKVRELSALAASASTDQSRDQLTTLSRQFEQLAECEDRGGLGNLDSGLSGFSA